jgi:hypothetical protein
VFAVNINQTNDQAQDILNALRKIQNTPELKAAIETNLESVMNMLGLSGITRHAVAVGIAGPQAGTIVGRAQNWW